MGGELPKSEMAFATFFTGCGKQEQHVYITCTSVVLHDHVMKSLLASISVEEVWLATTCEVQSHHMGSPPAESVTASAGRLACCMQGVNRCRCCTQIVLLYVYCSSWRACNPFEVCEQQSMKADADV